MSGESNLNRLLRNLDPILNKGEYVFCLVEQEFEMDENTALMEFNEAEGKTLILKKEIADRLGLKYESVFSWITLNIHSSLSASGLTAAFSSALAGKDISCNVVAAYYHDHLFVQIKDTEQALDILLGLSN